MSLIHEPAFVRPQCHGKGPRSLKSIQTREAQAATRQRRSLLKSISLPSISSVVRNSLIWAGDTWYATTFGTGSSKASREARAILEDRRKFLYFKMRSAVSYVEWRECACELDELENNDAWKETFECTEYNPKLIFDRMEQLKEARDSCDASRMLFLIRTCMSRDMGGMRNPALYSHSHVGTKDLIDDYITTALQTISKLTDLSENNRCDGLEMKYILDQLLAARQAFGRSALLFSGGATFGMNHIGVLKALWQANLLPRIISGASAGSIVCSIFCTRTDDEIPGLLNTFAFGNLNVFDDGKTEDTIFDKVARFLKHGAFLDPTLLCQLMKDWIGDITFQEAYNRTRRVLNICVSIAGDYELPRLLNYITAPNVLIWSAVTVSCTVPLVFMPSDLMAKDPVTGEAVPWNDLHKGYIDGSVDGDLPMTRLSEMFNVNHFIVSQVNPHVVPFLPRDDFQSLGQSPTSPSSWIHALTHLAKEEVLYRMTVLSGLGVFPNSLTKTISIVNQKYSGDINIYPEITYNKFPLILKNPTTEFVLDACLTGEQATWPKLGRIRNHCSIELALDTAIQKMRARVTFNPSEAESKTTAVPKANTEYIVDGGAGKGLLINRRSSCGHEIEIASKTRHISAYSRRPDLKRSCSARSSDESGSSPSPELPNYRSMDNQQSYFSRNDDGSSSLSESDDSDSDLPKNRPGPMKHRSSWGPTSHDYPFAKPLQHRSSQSSLFTPNHSSRISTGSIPRNSANLKDPSLPMDLKLPTKATPNSQSHLLRMTPTAPVISPDPMSRHLKN